MNEVSMHKFNPNSIPYQALLAASKGDVEKLTAIFQNNAEALGSLVQVQNNKPLYFTPLHYAIAKKQWPATAFLITHSVGLHVFSKTGEGKQGKAAFQGMNRPEAAKSVFEAMVGCENLPFETVIDLITSLSKICRQEILKSETLRHALYARFPKEEGLAVIAALMIGSYQWKPIGTDFHLLKDGVLPPFNATLNCSQFLLMASVLSGETTFAALKNLLLESIPIPTDEEQKIFYKAPNSEAARKIRMQHNQKMAEMLGLKTQDASNHFKPNTSNDSQVKLIAVVNTAQDNFVEHYGLLIQQSGKTKIIELHQSPATFMGVEISLSKWPGREFYTFMLPWHSEN